MIDINSNLVDLECQPGYITKTSLFREATGIQRAVYIAGLYGFTCGGFGAGTQWGDALTRGMNRSIPQQVRTDSKVSTAFQYFDNQQRSLVTYDIGLVFVDPPDQSGRSNELES